MTSTHDIAEAAREAAGNWQHFDSFGWNRAWDGSIDRPEDWTIVYTENRDSRLLDESNARAIGEILDPYMDGDDPDIIPEHHGHWACGWVDGYAIRVYRNGEITPAFRTWMDIVESLENYPVLDEEDYSQREYDATIENIRSEGRSIADEYELPDGWEGEVFSWFWDHNQHAVENRDDQGGYPSEEELREAFDSLYPRTPDHEDYEPLSSEDIRALAQRHAFDALRTLDTPFTFGAAHGIIRPDGWDRSAMFDAWDSAQADEPNLLDSDRPEFERSFLAFLR